MYNYSNLLYLYMHLLLKVKALSIDIQKLILNKQSKKIFKFRCALE
jgi:hypothetical protein